MRRLTSPIVILCAVLFSVNLIGQVHVNSNGNVGIGTNDPNDKLHVIGSIRIEDGKEDDGAVLMSDSQGHASWESLGGLIGNAFGGIASDLSCFDSVAFEDITASFPDRMQVRNGYLYILYFDTLKIIDVSVPSSPIVKSALGGFNDANDIAFGGQKAFVLDGTDLKVIDISSKSNPVVDTTWALPAGVNFSRALEQKDGYLYMVLSESGMWRLVTVDVRDIGSISVTSNIDLGSSSPSDIALYQDNVFMVLSSLDQVVAYNLADPEVPSYSGDITIGGFPQDLSVSRGIAFVFTNGDDSVKVIDIADPSAMTVVSAINLDGYTSGMAAAGSFLYLIEWDLNRFRVVDVSDPSSPTTVAEAILTQYFTYGIAASGSHAYLIGDYETEFYEYQPKLMVYQVSCTPLLSYDPVSGEVTRAGLGLSEVLTSGNDGGSLQIKNIADPTDPQDAVTKAYVDGLPLTMGPQGSAVMARLEKLEKDNEELRKQLKSLDGLQKLLESMENTHSSAVPNPD